jgi:hypothetical protein
LWYTVLNADAMLAEFLFIIHGFVAPSLQRTSKVLISQLI